MSDDKFLFFKSHPCSKGLSDEAVAEIVDQCELVQLEPGEYIHKANVVVDTVSLVISGRLKLKLIDLHGRVRMQRYVTRGGQYGGLTAALGEPAFVECLAEDPTTLLQIKFQRGLELTRTHDRFKQNLFQMLAEGAKQILLNDNLPKPPQMVAVFHQSPATREISRQLLQRLVELGEQPKVFSDQPEFEPVEGVHHRQVYFDKGLLLDEEHLRKVFDEWLDSPRIIADVSGTIDFARVRKMMTNFERVIWCVTVDNWQQAVPQLEQLVSLAPGWREKICVVWLLEEDSTVPVANELLRLSSENIKLSLSPKTEGPQSILQDGFERLIHLLRGIKIGIALGGGAARGMAHLGVLKALKNAGIVVDMIAGTSAGAMTGTVYAAGIDMDYAIDRFTNDLRPGWIFRTLPGGDYWHLFYKYRRRQFDPMLRKYFDDLRLEQLPLPMNSVTVDLVSGKALVRDTGDAVDGIIESINLPVLSVPVIRQGQALVDGGMINNVPADVLVAKGCNVVIAVSVTAKMELEFAHNRPDTPREEMKTPSTLQTILRTFLVQSSSVNSYGVEPADIVIEPDVTQFAVTDFAKTDQLAAIGETTTEEVLPNIKVLLKDLDPQLFPF